jgi:hypothetical protein
MTDTSDSQTEIIAKSAFLLMIGGVVVPLTIALLVFLVPGINLPEITVKLVCLLAVGLAFLSEVLALVLGIFSRQEPFAKAAMAGAGTLIVLAVLVPGFFTIGYSRSSTPHMTQIDTESAAPVPATPKHNSAKQ